MQLYYATRAVENESSEKIFAPERDSNPDLCDASAVLRQLSYQANWELVIRAKNINVKISSIHSSNEISLIKTQNQNCS